MDFSSLVLGPAMVAFGQPIMVTPTVSLPAAQPYAVQGVYQFKPVQIPLENGTYHSTNEAHLGIRLSDCPAPPLQGDVVVMTGVTYSIEGRDPGRPRRRGSYSATGQPVTGAPVYYPSSPIAIRDGTWQRLQGLSPFGGRVFRYRTIPTKDEQLPCICVFHGGEDGQPRGDSNTAEPKFEHRLTLAVDVLVKAGSEADLDGAIVPMVEAVKVTLLTDPSWVALVEGIERCSTRYAYPGDTNFFFVQATILFEVTFSSDWPSYVPNDLETVAVFDVNLPNSPEVLEVDFPAQD